MLLTYSSTVQRVNSQGQGKTQSLCLCHDSDIIIKANLKVLL